MRTDDFERRLLRMASETDAPLTEATVAYHVGCPVTEARTHLRRMLDAHVLTLDSDDAGDLVYVLPGRAALAGQPLARPPAGSDRPARVLNALLPGAGSLWIGRVRPALAQSALALGAAGLLIAFWKDFGDSEHRPWLVALGAAYLGSWIWAFRTTSPPPDDDLDPGAP